MSEGGDHTFGARGGLGGMSAHSKQGVVGTGGTQGAGSFAIWSCSLAGFREKAERNDKQGG